ncbi:hypothetical protein C8J57DRAFT_1232759 [Mycena rebaudengoi]|nr:hypothetical protein C8J57DRAFT_1232759 [Mycena rebaudengoi]
MSRCRRGWHSSNLRRDIVHYGYYCDEVHLRTGRLPIRFRSLSNYHERRGHCTTEIVSDPTATSPPSPTSSSTSTSTGGSTTRGASSISGRSTTLEIGPTPSPKGTSVVNAGSSRSRVPTSAIAGAIVGSFMSIAIIGFLLWLRRRRTEPNTIPEQFGVDDSPVVRGTTGRAELAYLVTSRVVLGRSKGPLPNFEEEAVGPAKYPQVAFRGSIVEVGADIVNTFPLTETDMMQMTREKGWVRSERTETEAVKEVLLTAEMNDPLNGRDGRVSTGRRRRKPCPLAEEKSGLVSAPPNPPLEADGPSSQDSTDIQALREVVDLRRQNERLTEQIQELVRQVAVSPTDGSEDGPPQYVA